MKLSILISTAIKCFVVVYISFIYTNVQAQSNVSGITDNGNLYKSQQNTLNKSQQNTLNKSQQNNKQGVEKGINVTDLAGRDLYFEKVPQRIILGESRYIFALSILNKNQPFKNVIGMVNSLKQIDFGSYQQYREQFPEIDTIPLVGHASADSFSVEKTLSLRADLAIFGVDGHGPNSRNRQLIDQLQNAGVQVVFIDFRNDPITNTIKSITLLGDILGRQQQAKDYTDFYQKQLQRVTDRLEDIQSQSNKPSVFLHSRVGLQDLCCETMVRGMMATFLEHAQGHNVAKKRIPGSAGVLNLEYLLIQQPDVYIATAIGSKSIADYQNQQNIPPYITLGAGISEQGAKQSFIRALNHSGINELQAIKSKRAYAIWHHFYNSPLNIVAVQVFAKWLYPQEFSDLNPRQTMQELFKRFQSVPLEGTYWLALDQKVSG